MTTSSPSGRYGIAPAPGGLVLVQDLLNTVSIAGSADLLVDTSTAEEWLAVALGAASQARVAERPPLALTEDDLAQLRGLREQLRGILSGSGGSRAPSGALGLAMGSDGTVAATPRGSGAAWVRSAVLAECFVAQHHDIWRRLKLCHNPLCASAFYDRSRNNSGVWHDVHVCGNAANLRASRARRRAPATRQPE